MIVIAIRAMAVLGLKQCKGALMKKEKCCTSSASGRLIQPSNVLLGLCTP